MDIDTVTSYRAARTRADARLAPGEAFLAGGTWLLSEPQPDTTGWVDLTTLAWPDLEPTRHGLRIAATCTIARLVEWAQTAAPSEWPAAAAFPDAANALLASFKVWRTATVGGNIARGFAAAGMVALTAGLDGTALVWTPDGGERRVPVAELVTGNGETSLAHGELIRAIDLPADALRTRLHVLKIALAEYGRSGAVVTARRTLTGGAVFALTAATERPVVLRFEDVPDAATLRAAVSHAPGYYTDPLGSADWRRGVSTVLAERARGRLLEETP